MGLLIVPKLMAYLTLALSNVQRRAFRGMTRVFAALLVETVIAALIAPAMMVFQARAVTEIGFGRDSGWEVQRRDDGAVSRIEVARKLTSPTLVGVAMALAAYSISVPLLLWMSPVVVGLLVSIPIGLLTSMRLQSPGVLATPEDIDPPPVVARAAELARRPRPPSGDALSRLRDDAALRASHCANMLPTGPKKGGKIDVTLATARAKIDLCETFADATAWLDKRETRALLGDRDLLMRALALP